MKTQVKVINPAGGMYAAEINGEGEYVIFELLDTSAPEIDDIVSHPDFYSLGCETYKNITQGCNIEVVVEDVCGASLVKQRCFI